MSWLPARTQQLQTQEKRISCLMRQQEKELAKKWAKKKKSWQSWVKSVHLLA
jgi:hypothetical protein